MTGNGWTKGRNGTDEAAPERDEPAADAVEAAAPVEEAVTAERLAKAEAEAARLKNEYLRALAETENVRKRAARERQEASQYAISAFARDLLSVADNLQRALAAVDPQAKAVDPALQALISGVEMTEKELLTIFERYGIKPIPAEGQPFDPHVHEAMYELPDPSVPQGTVVQVVQPGYTLHDRTLRPARVGIARGGPRPGAAAIAPDAEVQARRAGRESDPYAGPDAGPGSRFDETH